MVYIPPIYGGLADGLWIADKPYVVQTITKSP